MLLCSSKWFESRAILEWIDVMNLASSSHSLNEFRSLLQQFMENAEKWTNAYAYHVLNHRYEYVSCHTKCYLPMHKKASLVGTVVVY